MDLRVGVDDEMDQPLDLRVFPSREEPLDLSSKVANEDGGEGEEEDAHI